MNVIRHSGRIFSIIILNGNVPPYLHGNVKSRDAVLQWGVE